MQGGAHPDGILIASVMEEYRKDAWVEIIERTQEVGRRRVRAQLLVSARACPSGSMGVRHGAGLRDILEEVCGWVCEREHRCRCGRS